MKFKIVWSRHNLKWYYFLFIHFDIKITLKSKFEIFFFVLTILIDFFIIFFALALLLVNILVSSFLLGYAWVPLVLLLLFSSFSCFISAQSTFDLSFKWTECSHERFTNFVFESCEIFLSETWLYTSSSKCKKTFEHFYKVCSNCYFQFPIRFRFNLTISCLHEFYAQITRQLVETLLGHEWFFGVPEIVYQTPMNWKPFSKRSTKYFTFFISSLVSSCISFILM